MSGRNHEETDSSERTRLAAVRRYDILGTPPDGAFDRVVAIAARSFAAPMATVSIVDEDRIWFKAVQGIEGVRQVDRDLGLCASAILQGEPFVIADTLQHAQAVTNPLVRGALGIRFYAAAPITTHDGYRLGTVNVLDTRPREAGRRQTATLEDLAGIVADELELRMAGIRAVRLEHELHRVQEEQFHTATESHAVIDHAIGMLMAARHCTADHAWNTLLGLSQHTNTKLRDVAESMTRLTTGMERAAPPDALHRAIYRALRPTGTTRRTPKHGPNPTPGSRA